MFDFVTLELNNKTSKQKSWKFQRDNPGQIGAFNKA